LRPSPLGAGRHDRDRLRGGAARHWTGDGGRVRRHLGPGRGGDETAFACLFRDLQPALLRYLQVLTLEAEDVAGDTWLQVARGLPGFRAAAGISILAAYADVLPTPVQQLAHAAGAAPPPHHSGQRVSVAPTPRTTAASGCPWRRNHRREPHGQLSRSGQPHPRTGRLAQSPAPAGPQRGPRGPRGDGRSGLFAPAPPHAASPAWGCPGSPGTGVRVGRLAVLVTAEHCTVPILSSRSATGLTRPSQLPLAARPGKPANDTSPASRAVGNETVNRHPPHRISLVLCSSNVRDYPHLAS
jgi:hypothetical protein